MSSTNLVKDAIERLRSNHSKYLSNEYIQEWLDKTTKDRKDRLCKAREHIYKYIEDELGRFSNSASEQLRIFASKKHHFLKNDKVHEPVLKKESEQLGEKLSDLSDEICNDFTPLCKQEVAAIQSPITQQVIDGVVAFLEDRFDRVKKSYTETEPDEGFRKSMDFVLKVEKFEAERIVKHHLRTLQVARQRAAIGRQKSDAQFIEKLQQTKPKARKDELKCKKNHELSLTRPDSSNTTSLLKKRMGVVLATHGGDSESHGIGHEGRASQQRELAEDGLGQYDETPWENQTPQSVKSHETPSNNLQEHENLRIVSQSQEKEAALLPEAQQREALMEYNFTRQELQLEQRESEANKEREQREQQAANERRDVEKLTHRQDQTMTESIRTFAASQRILEAINEDLQRLRQEDNQINNENGQRATKPTGEQELGRDQEALEEDIEMGIMGKEQSAGLDQRQPEPPACDRYTAMDAETPADSDQHQLEYPQPSAEDSGMMTNNPGEQTGGPDQCQPERLQPPVDDRDIAMDAETPTGSDQRQLELRKRPQPFADSSLSRVLTTNSPGEQPVYSDQRQPEYTYSDIVTNAAGGSANPDQGNQGQQEDIKQLWEHLHQMSDAIDQNSKLLQLVLDRTRSHPQPGPTASPSTPQDSNEIVPMKMKGRFRVPARPVAHRNAEKLNIRDAVRKHMNKLMKRTRNDSPEPAPEEDIKKYKSTMKKEDGPSKDRFQADFSETNPKQSVWNTRLADVFVNDYVQNRLPAVDLDDLSDYFYTYLRTLQTNYRKRTTTKDTAGGNTAYEEVSKRDRIEKRKKSRFETQISALYFHGIQRFVEPLSRMTHAVLSEDESDHEGGSNLGRSRYAIVKEAWRSDDLMVWLRTIDLLAYGEKWAGRNVARRGNGRRHRTYSTRSKDGVAVSGLPENCYNRDWLDSLKGYERATLNVQQPLDMTFSEEERSQAARFIPLAEGEAQLPNHNTSSNTNTSDLDKWLLYKFGEPKDL